MPAVPCLVDGTDLKGMEGAGVRCSLLSDVYDRLSEHRSANAESEAMDITTGCIPSMKQKKSDTHIVHTQIVSDTVLPTLIVWIFPPAHDEPLVDLPQRELVLRGRHEAIKELLVVRYVVVVGSTSRLEVVIAGSATERSNRRALPGERCSLGVVAGEGCGGQSGTAERCGGCCVWVTASCE